MASVWGTLWWPERLSQGEQARRTDNRARPIRRPWKSEMGRRNPGLARWRDGGCSDGGKNSIAVKFCETRNHKNLRTLNKHSETQVVQQGTVVSLAHMQTTYHGDRRIATPKRQPTQAGHVHPPPSDDASCTACHTRPVEAQQPSLADCGRYDALRSPVTANGARGHAGGMLS